MFCPDGVASQNTVLWVSKNEDKAENSLSLTSMVLLVLLGLF